MITSTHITITISNNGSYWRERGYGPCKQRDLITVRVSDLPKNSNKKVDCTCDVCGDSFSRQYQLLMRQEEQRCHQCHRNYVGRVADKSKNIAIMKTWIGPLHPRWRGENRTEFQRFTRKVHALTRLIYVKNKDTLNPHNYPRTLCGVEGGYQLDHIVSIKKAYDLGWTPEECSAIGNLQLLPWKENRDKW